jgi:hypothetical protein
LAKPIAGRLFQQQHGVGKAELVAHAVQHRIDDSRDFAFPGDPPRERRGGREI